MEMLKGGLTFVNYYKAKTITEVLDLLRSANGRGRVIAGGSDLMLDIQEGKLNPDTLIDITPVSEMRQIRVEKDRLIIGAAATLTEIASSAIVKQYYPSLAQGAGVVGSLQIRNSATLIGNVISAQPAADAAMAIAPLEPQFLILGSDGSERVAFMGDMYAGFGKSTVDPSRELVSQVSVPLPGPHEAAAFTRLELRKSLSLPMINVAAMACIEDGCFKWARITMGPAGVGPVRARVAEEWLVGKECSMDNLVQAGKLASENAAFRSNPLRGSKEFRGQTLPVLVKRTLAEICRQLDVNI
jgi:CO/xanthine dehydrogenase FAD-binding subunit